MLALLRRRSPLCYRSTRLQQSRPCQCAPTVHVPTVHVHRQSCAASFVWDRINRSAHRYAAKTRTVCPCLRLSCLCARASAVYVFVRFFFVVVHTDLIGHILLMLSVYPSVTKLADARAEAARPGCPGMPATWHAAQRPGRPGPCRGAHPCRGAQRLEPGRC
jgi:hypothetical protein